MRTEDGLTSNIYFWTTFLIYGLRASLVVYTYIHTCLAIGTFSLIFPEWSNTNFVPHACDECLVVIITSLRAHNELNASPRKPKVSTEVKSANSWILDVWCFKATKKKKKMKTRYHV